jgi:hypothetical protein
VVVGQQTAHQCQTTDASGSFEMKFLWCCGYYPWWWWQHRIWQLEPVLADHIVPALQAAGIRLRKEPQAKPDPSIFQELLGELSAAAPARPGPFDPKVLTGMRDRLIKSRRLPHVAVLENLRIWPWWPWEPWNDCNPDVIFPRHARLRRAVDKVIYEEGLGAVRWNIPTNFSLTLTANDEACCLETPPDDPEGMCVLLAEACGVPVNNIGGNAGAPAGPVGYANPGSGDNPFAAAVRLDGQLGDAVDYYQFEVSDDGVTWNLMPAPAAGGFSRLIWEPPSTFSGASFAPQTVDGRLVYETRRHYEETHAPGSWNVTRFWMPTH